MSGASRRGARQHCDLVAGENGPLGYLTVVYAVTQGGDHGPDHGPRGAQAATGRDPRRAGPRGRPAARLPGGPLSQVRQAELSLRPRGGRGSRTELVADPGGRRPDDHPHHPGRCRGTARASRSPSASVCAGSRASWSRSARNCARRSWPGTWGRLRGRGQIRELQDSLRHGVHRRDRSARRSGRARRAGPRGHRDRCAPARPVGGGAGHRGVCDRFVGDRVMPRSSGSGAASKRRPSGRWPPRSGG